jgi:hypothetical protein
MAEKRDYRAEYLAFHASPEQRRRRAQRNKARRLLIKMGRARKGDGKDVDHIHSSKHGSLNNNPSNLRVTSKRFNRSRNNNR